MLKELKLHNGLLINTDEILIVERQNAPKSQLQRDAMRYIAPDDPEHRYVVLMKNKDTYYLTKKEYDSLRCEHPYSPMDEIYDRFKESLGLGVDKELRITNSEVIHRDGNSIQLKLTCEF